MTSKQTTKKQVSFSIFLGFLLAIVWMLPVYAEWQYSAASEPPLSQAYEKIGLLGNFEVSYLVRESPNHSPALGFSLRQALRTFFPVFGSESLIVSARPGRILLSVLLTLTAIVVFRRFQDWRETADTPA